MRGWEAYYALTGAGAVTLIGLLFVVITLGAASDASGDQTLSRTFLTPTLVHFGVVFLIALLALSPAGDTLILPFGLVGIVGLIYSWSTALKAVRYGGLFSDTWLWHGGIPILCYGGIIVAARWSETSTRQAYSVLGVVSALLLVIGMRNAWAVAMDLAQRKAK